MKTLTTIFILLFTFITPIKGLLILMFIMVLFDTGFGIYTSIKLYGQKKFKSHYLFNIAVKLFFYQITIFTAFLINKYIFGSTILGIDFLLPKLATLIFSYIEIKSLDESSMKLGNPSLWVIIKDLINKMKALKKDINDVVEDKEDK